MANRSFFSKDFLPVMQKNIRKIRADLQAEGKATFRTVDLIKRYIGRYTPDNTNPNDSLNANIGKFLKENAESLRIYEKEAKKSIKIGGKQTTTSVWQFI